MSGASGGLGVTDGAGAGTDGDGDGAGAGTDGDEDETGPDGDGAGRGTDGDGDGAGAEFRPDNLLCSASVLLTTGGSSLLLSLPQLTDLATLGEQAGNTGWA